jgi:hypothetical protein
MLVAYHDCWVGGVRVSDWLACHVGQDPGQSELPNT